MMRTLTNRREPKRAARLLGAAGLLSRLHRNERGTISIVSVFAIFMFTVLLMMIVNVGRLTDDKTRMQNAADSSAYSGATVIARGMNAVAFSNHLLCETFALVAFMQEGEARSIEPYMPEILDMWNQIGPVYQQAGQFASSQTGNAQNIGRFTTLGQAIPGKVPLEQELVTAFGDMAEEHAELTLEALEHILHGPNDDPSDPLGGYIPRFQRSVLQWTPIIANMVVHDIANRQGREAERNHRNQPLEALLWRTDGSYVQAVGVNSNETDPLTRTLPIIDPSPSSPTDYGVSGTYEFNRSSSGREQLADLYLRNLSHWWYSKGDDWIRHWMVPYFSHPLPTPGPYFDAVTNDFGADVPGAQSGKMSQMIVLWRLAARKRLQDLLDQYPTTNLPFVFRHPYDPDQVAPDALLENIQPIEHDHNFVAVTYWPHLDEMFPGLFRNPLKDQGGSDAFTFSQAVVYLPRNRHYRRDGSFAYPVQQRDPTTGQVVTVWISHMQNWPGAPFGGSPIRRPPTLSNPSPNQLRVIDWEMFTQNWTAKLVPAVSGSIPTILQQTPPNASWFRPPNLAGATIQDMNQISTH